VPTTHTFCCGPASSRISSYCTRFRILIFIHVDYWKRACHFNRVGVDSGASGRPQQEIIEVQRLAVMKKFFVRRENVAVMPPILIERLGSKLFRGLAVFFRIADTAQNDSRRQGIIFDLQFISSPV